MKCFFIDVDVHKKALKILSKQKQNAIYVLYLWSHFLLVDDVILSAPVNWFFLVFCVQFLKNVERLMKNIFFH